MWIDDKNTGYTTPTIAMRLTAGGHRVELRDPSSGRTIASEVRIRQGETARLTLQFQARQ